MKVSITKFDYKVLQITINNTFKEVNDMSTMKDVAKLAGVSHGTVSNILNGAKNVGMNKDRPTPLFISTM